MFLVRLSYADREHKSHPTKNTCNAMLISIFCYILSSIKQRVISLVARLPGRYIIMHFLLCSVSVPLNIFFIIHRQEIHPDAAYARSSRLFVDD